MKKHEYVASGTRIYKDGVLMTQGEVLRDLNRDQACKKCKEREVTKNGQNQ